MNLEATITGILGFLTHRESSCRGRNFKLERKERVLPPPMPHVGRELWIPFAATTSFWILGWYVRHRDTLLRFPLQERAHFAAVKLTHSFHCYLVPIGLHSWAEISWGGPIQWLCKTVTQVPIHFCLTQASSHMLRAPCWAGRDFVRSMSWFGNSPSLIPFPSFSFTSVNPNKTFTLLNLSQHLFFGGPQMTQMGCC